MGMIAPDKGKGGARLARDPSGSRVRLPGRRPFMFREHVGILNMGKRVGLVAAFAVSIGLWVCIIALARWVWTVACG